MREIKFRAWDDIDKIMHVHDRCHLGRGFGTLLFGFEPQLSIDKKIEDYVVEQFTGLKDKNGVEIYEGSILSCPWFKNGSIVFIDGSFQLQSETTQHILTDMLLSEDYEVIGNIHENLELLK